MAVAVAVDGVRTRKGQESRESRDSGDSSNSSNSSHPNATLNSGRWVVR
jgi:hypothetical protein